ncbi:hypothetical protein CEP53_006269 [Fusarium sp. AF-6]|nr:hypothetical protein CEP53_006269 [Fusarium sp. AF-6]
MVVQVDPSSPVSRAVSSPCDVCHDFQPVETNPRASPFDRMFNLYNTNVDSLHDECPRCSLLKTIFLRLQSSLLAQYDEFEPINREGTQSSGIWIGPNSDGTVLARCTWNMQRKKGEGDTYFYREVHIHPAAESEIPKSLTMKKLHNTHWNPKSEECVQFVKDLLQTCEAGQGDHHHCRSEHSPPLPTRVVRINPEDESLSLHESQPGETGAYVALSHCWGPPNRQPIRTTQDTISHMRVSVPESELSHVFRDTIWLSKQLGVQYVWIDSLCIIQDDAVDWEIESAKMADYYSQAHLTVAAESSMNGTIPFLQESGDRWQRMIYSAPDQDGHPLTFAFQEHFSNEAFVRGPHNYWKDGHNILPTRAWTLQESILSRRIVRFSLSDIIWECQSTSQYHDSSRVLRTADLNIRKAIYALHNLEASDEERREGADSVWESLVSMYAVRGITYDLDKLPAFSGIAASLAPIFQGRYFAGIWEAHLPHGLGWSTGRMEHYQLPRCSLEQYIAPSWSWASLPTAMPVHFMSRVGEELEPDFQPKLLEAFCERSDTAPFGRVRSGYILLEAPIFEATLTCESSMNRGVKYKLDFGSEYGGGEITDEFYEDCLLAEEYGFVKRATTDSRVEYQQDPSTFRATAWVLWLYKRGEAQLCGIVLGMDELAEGFERVGYISAGGITAEMLPKNPVRRQLKLI